MIETKTLIRLSHELVAFGNTPAPEDLPAFQDMIGSEHEEGVRTLAAQRKLAQAGLAELAAWKPSNESAPPKLVRAALRWMDSPPVRNARGGHAAFRLERDGRLQVVPEFHSGDWAKFAVTFAALIQPDAPAMVRRCATCKRFFVALRGARGQPRKLCDEHYEQSKLTKKTTNRKETAQ